MSSPDPYHELLGIPPEERPVNHYRLLGLRLFEGDAEVIRNAFDMRVSFLRNLGAGEYSDISQQLLNELAQAQVCLTEVEKKTAYDQRLRAKLTDIRSPKDNVGELVKQTLAPRTWDVGKSLGCDIRVDRPEVSRIHCRLSETPAGLQLVDLDSTNGTFVNHQQITKRVIVTTKDLITLGTKILFPWPSELLEADRAARTIHIGRAEDNHVVLPAETVSAHHARLIVRDSSLLLEDLGSRNGTAVGEIGNRITSCGLAGDELLFFGKCPIHVARLLARV